MTALHELMCRKGTKGFAYCGARYFKHLAQLILRRELIAAAHKDGIGISFGVNADYGEAAARVRMEDVFAPFLGRRLPPGEALPPLTGAWLGDGDLLRTSPEAFLRWLMEPEQSGVLTFGKRYLAGFWVDVKSLMGHEDWWFKLGTHAVPGEPAPTCTWVAGGRGMALVVLYLPHGLGKEEARARIRKILGEKG